MIEEQAGKTMLQEALRVLEMEDMDFVAVKNDIEFYDSEVRRRGLAERGDLAYLKK